MMIHHQHNPYASAARTAEIMSRYRPIAPKPEGSPESGGDSPVMSEKIKQSPYLRSIWAQLQARPTRTRKRGRNMALSPTSFKRSSASTSSSSARIVGLFGAIPSPLPYNSIAKNLSLHGFSQVGPGACLLPAGTVDGLRPITTTTECLVTLPLLPGHQQTSPPECDQEVIDLNKEAVHEESDSHHLALQLQPCTAAVRVIAPQPIKPIGSTINVVGRINVENDVEPSPPEVVLPLKKPDEVEEEVELEALPAVISDSKNQVRLANSAYKKMVGQPECSWLDSMCACNRISGEVMLRILDGSGLPLSGNGFSCWVNIEWGRQDGNNSSSKKKDSVTAYCDVMRLSCASKDYLLTWRFHTQAPPPEGSNSSLSSSATN